MNNQQNDKKMSKNGGNFISLLVGTALGVTAGFYLNSQEGKKLRKKVMKRLDEMETSIEEKVSTAYNDLKGRVTDTADRVKSVSDSANNSVKSASDTVNDQIKEKSNKVKEATSNSHM